MAHKTENLNLLRIAYFSKQLDNIPFIINQVEEINKAQSVLYLCNKKSNDLNVDFEIREINLSISKHILRIKYWFELHDIYMNFRNANFSSQLNNEIENFNPQIIHIQFGYDALMFFDNSYSSYRNYIIQFRGYDASNKLVSKNYRKKIATILAKPNVYPIFVSHSLVENLRKYNIRLKNNPFILYSNTNTEFFKRNLKPTTDSFIFLQISSFREKKGHNFTLKAFRQFLDFSKSNNKIKLVFTGFSQKNEHCIQIFKLTKDLNLENNVIFHNWVDRDRTKELLQESHVAIQHSVTTYDNDQEGIPNYLMEAMAMELPVISTYHSGIPELVGERAFGILIKEKDIESYAKAMQWMYTHWRLSPENRAIVVEKFSKSRHIKELQNHYYKILNNVPS